MFTEDENRLIENKFEELRLIALKRCADQEEYEVILKAFELAKIAHNGVRRRSGGPYIMHPIEVALIVVKEIGLGYKSISAALLHDVVEDADYTVEDIERLFGAKIASLVEGLTKVKGAIGSYPQEDSSQVSSAQAEHFKRMLIAMNDDIRVILIKLADRLHNMRTIEFLPERKKAKILGETKLIFIPLAHKLGLYTIKSELEDIWLRNTLPEEYYRIQNMVSRVAIEKGEAMEEFIKDVSGSLKEARYKFSISKRTKTPYSIWEKMNKKSIPFEEIYDLYAARIVFEVKKGDSDSIKKGNERIQCFHIYSLITALFDSIDERMRDWAERPKPNGYEALHCTIRGLNGNLIEVQIRTKRMNDIAERGVAAHWDYKNVMPTESELDKWLAMVRAILENPNASAVIDQVVEIFEPTIEICTPKGEIRQIPNRATALDFAYSIHSEIGNRALAAKVNYKLVPLSYELRNGDQIEIITAESQKPKREWLKFVKTSKAKTLITQALRLEVKDSLKRGQAILDEKLSELDIKPSISIYKKLAGHYKMVNKEELFSKVENGLVDLSDLGKILKKGGNIFGIFTIPIPFIKSTPKDEEDGTDSEIESKHEIDKKKVYLLEEDPVEKTHSYSVATCCRPIPGDEVVGFMTKNGLVVHKKDCPDATALAAKHAEEIVNTKWSRHTVTLFPIRIDIKGIDRVGLISVITKHITHDFNLNISRILIEANDGIFSGSIDLFVHNITDLKVLIKALSKIPGIQSISRMEITSH